jgi:hypothetical protein
LSIQDGDGTVDFGLSSRLFLPDAVRTLVVGPADEIGRDDVRIPASQAFAFLNVEVARRGGGMRLEFWATGHASVHYDFMLN